MRRVCGSGGGRREAEGETEGGEGEGGEGGQEPGRVEGERVDKENTIGAEQGRKGQDRAGQSRTEQSTAASGVTNLTNHPCERLNPDSQQAIYFLAMSEARRFEWL